MSCGKEENHVHWRIRLYTPLVVLFAEIATCWKDVDDPYKSSSYTIYGMVADRNTRPDYDDIMRHGCFTGIGFSKCQLAENAEEPDLQNKPFHLDNTLENGKAFCLECCSNSRNRRGFLETWSFSCDWQYEADTIEYNLFNKQLRFATRQTLTSLEVTQCEIKRPRERQVISIVPSGTARVNPDWKFHLGVWDAALGQWEYTAQISANATGAQTDEYEVTGVIDIADDGSLPCTKHVDCPGDSIESKLETIFRSLTDSVASEEEDEEDSDDDWKQPKQGISGLSGVHVSRGPTSNLGAFTWTVTWPFYQHNIPQLEALIIGSNFSDAVINITTLPNRHLHGYHLMLGVVEMSNGLDFWRSTTYCNVQIIEGDEPPDEFTEMWSMEFANGAVISHSGHVHEAWRYLFSCCAVIFISIEFAV